MTKSVPWKKKAGPKSFQEVIQFFKAKEKVDDTICLFPGNNLDSDSLRRIVIAWPKIKKSMVIIQEEVPTEEWEMWKWAWKGVSYSLDTLREVAGVGESSIGIFINILIGNYLLYPDGTTSSFANKIIQQVLKKELSI